jgi:hypothetical protein
MAEERLDEEFGWIERHCLACDDWWPADKEFFFSGGHGRLMSKCKACYTEIYKKDRGEKREELGLGQRLVANEVNGGSIPPSRSNGGQYEIPVGMASIL